MAQEVEIGIAIVVRTTRPDLWNTPEEIAASMVVRKDEMKLCKSHNYGRPSTDTAERGFKIEFEEKED